MQLPITAALIDVADTLADAGIRAELDPARLTLPGVWVRPTGIALDLLGAASVQAEAVCIAPDRDHRRALVELEKLAGLVLDVLDPTDLIQVASVQLPHQSQPMPALVIPATVHADYE